ncbi:MAG: RNA polymerase sigma factor [Candidatus Pseudobacter hemicellulosilyticus]|uniref:RNA polymerase sigma factor n=1 Tax=Candidatus Pseudobacter hemicellulosilyticus TaxID=3121375 RepID=A0AAJ5WXC0_9BACT|nr:MAG: RNA polymerase sigma factor [Pseudobacter sp.]
MTASLYRISTPYTEQQFEELFRRSYPRVLAYLLKLCGQQDLAEDLAQNLFLRLWEQPASLPAAAEEANYYLFTMARHLFYQHTRRLLKEQQQLHAFAQLHQDTAARPEPITQALTEKESVVTELFNSIDPLQKKIFLLNKEDGLSYQEIARQTGVSSKTVMRYVGSVSRLLRARLSSWIGIIG